MFVSIQRFINQHPAFFLLISLAIIRGLIYISIIPPWLAPDEATHFEAIRLIGQEQMWPTAEVYLTTPMHPEMHPSFVTFQIWQTASLQPPFGDPTHNPYIYYYPILNQGQVLIAGEYSLLYHVVLAPLSALSQSFGIITQLYLLRFVSLFFILLTVSAVWLTARILFSNIGYAVAISSFFVFLPMNLHINTAVNSDTLATTFATFYLLILAQLLCQEITKFKLTIAIIVLILAILTKPTTLFLLPTTAVALIIYIGHQKKWSLVWLSLLLVPIALFTLIGSVLLFQGASGGRAFATLSFTPELLSLNPSLYLTPQSVNLYISTVQYGFLSFWGAFGWAGIRIPGVWAWALWRICFILGIGIALFLVKQVLWEASSTLSRNQRNVFLLLLFSLIFALIGIYAPIIGSQSATWGPQSRYLFPALLPIAIYFFIGFQQLVPAYVRGLLLPIWLLLLASFDAVVLASVIIPSIYG